MSEKSPGAEQPRNRRSRLEVIIPNVTTREAIAQLEAGQGTRFASTDELIADLNAKD